MSCPFRTAHGLPHFTTERSAERAAIERADNPYGTTVGTAYVAAVETAYDAAIGTAYDAAIEAAV